MENDSLSREFSENLSALKRCSKTYSICFWVYAVVCLVYLIYAVLKMSAPILYMLSGLAACGVEAYFAMRGMYSHNNFAAAVSAFFPWIEVLLAVAGFGSPVYTYTALAASGAGAAVIAANRKYLYLEQQYGFPYFNERIEYHKLDSRQADIKSEFQQNYERFRKTEADSMNDLGADTDSAYSSAHTDNKTDTGARMDEI